MSFRQDVLFRAPSFDDINFSFQPVLRLKMPPKTRGKQNSKEDSEMDCTSLFEALSIKLDSMNSTREAA